MTEDATGNGAGGGEGARGGAEIPLEVVILLIGGMATLIAGALLFPVAAGALPFYENGLLGLLLVVVGLQTITLGKTPFGDLRRSRSLFGAGVGVASAGILTCFVPAVPPSAPRTLLLLFLGPGGGLMLGRMLLDRERFAALARRGGALRRMVGGCAAVYALAIGVAAALLLGAGSRLSLAVVGGVLSVHGGAILFLAGVLREVYRQYPEAAVPDRGDVGLSTDLSILLLVGVFMTLLGLVLVPVNLGLLPFSGSAQLGLLLVIFAVQTLASGSTPVGAFPRTGRTLAVGLAFAAVGIVSCLIPDRLTGGLTLLVGVLNILGGGAGLAGVLRARRAFGPGTAGAEIGDGAGPAGPEIAEGAGAELVGTGAGPGAADPRPALPPILGRLFALQTATNGLSVLFGASMLLPGLVPGLLVAVVLALNGIALLGLIRVLALLEAMQEAAAAGPLGEGRAA